MKFINALFLKKAFTLIELLAVMCIIGIISVIGLFAFDGYMDNAKRAVCTQNADFFEKEIMRKWINAKLKSTADVELTSSGHCYVHWLPGNAHMGSKGFDITVHMKSNSSSPTHCGSDFEGQESTVHDHFYGMGYRNPLLGSHGQLNAKAALDSPNRGGVLREGGSYFACGSNGGLSNPYHCKLTTMCELNNKVEKILIKP